MLDLPTEAEDLHLLRWKVLKKLKKQFECLMAL